MIEHIDEAMGRGNGGVTCCLEEARELSQLLSDAADCIKSLQSTTDGGTAQLSALMLSRLSASLS